MKKKELKTNGLQTFLAAGFLGIATWAAINKTESGHEFFKGTFIAIVGVQPPGQYYDRFLPVYILLYLVIFAVFTAFFWLMLTLLPAKYRMLVGGIIIAIGVFYPLLKPLLHSIF